MLRHRLSIRGVTRYVGNRASVRLASTVARRPFLADAIVQIPVFNSARFPAPVHRAKAGVLPPALEPELESDKGPAEVPEEPETPEKKDPEQPPDPVEKVPNDGPEEPEKDVVEVDNIVTGVPGEPAAAGGAGAPPNGENGNGNGNNGDGNGEDGNSGDLPAAHPDTGLYPPLLAIPMRDRPPLPGRPSTISITDPDVINSIKVLVNQLRQPYFVLFHLKGANEPDADVIKTKESVHAIGVLMQVISYVEPRNGVFNVIAYPLLRVRLEELTITSKDGPKEIAESEEFPSPELADLKVSYATVRAVSDEPYDKEAAEVKSLVMALKTLLGDMGQKNPLSKVDVNVASLLSSDPSKLADFVASTTHGDPKKIQDILEDLNVASRLLKTLELLKVELKASSIKENAIHTLSLKADEYQTRVFIKEMIKELQTRAGLNESEDKKTSKFDERLKHLKLTEEALEAYNAEKAKMANQNEHSSELGVSERYLDWLTSIPWGIYSKDRFNIREARKVLERDHFGLNDVKDRILEFISIGKVSGKVDGKILCLVGPPGTGKTSIARSISEALNRKYVRIAMGGIQDVHEVKGHRRTYVGSIPGRIISALKQAKTSNPLMLIDEIDKLDLSRGGGAASAFLEILDPEQNNAFVDNYIDVKVDLSKVLFVCTANYLGNIPAPLRDRMEIIDVSGYTNNEKLEIAKRHLIPDAAKKAGLDEKHIEIPPETIIRLIEKYCRESGLRNIKKLITRIFSKASLQIVEEIEEADAKAAAEKEKTDLKAAAAPEVGSGKATEEGHETKKTDDSVKRDDNSAEPIAPVERENKEPQSTEGATETEDVLEKLAIPDHIKLQISPENLKKFVGPEVYTRDRIYDIPPPGVATGLAYSTSGNGDALYIESILTQSIGSGSGHAGMHVTGSLKDVMKESASIAYSFAKLLMTKKFPENRFFEAADIHVHCPDGAIPKDGPSAGIAFTSSLLSLALNQPLPPTVAMTGEITVTGRVLPVGGLREKTLGAKRYGCTTIIFPKDIQNELEEIPEEVKEGIEFIPVEWYLEVFEKVFPNLTEDQCSSVWKSEFAKLDEKKNKK